MPPLAELGGMGPLSFTAAGGGGRKGAIEYVHKLANEQIKSQKPVTFKVINEILAYCNISITEEILNSLINAPSIVIKNLDQNETKKILKDNIGLPSSSSSSSSSRG